MLSTQHLFSHQQQYGHDQSSWQQHSNQNQSHQGTNHAHQHAQAQAAAVAAATAQHQHYNRIASNPNHTSLHAQNTSNNRQSSGDNSTAGGGFGVLGDQASPGLEQNMSEDNRKVLQWVAQLMDPDSREAALMELSKKREQVPELALVLWHSFGVMTSLLQEIISVYPLLNPSQLTAAASNRVCNALALLQCVASHNETRTLFLSGG